MIPPPKSQLYIARLLMSLLATALLWGTSLNVVTSVVQLDSVIPLPPLQRGNDSVIRRIIELVDETVSVRDGYSKCVSGEVTICNSSLLKARKVETARVANASSSNAVRVQSSLNNATRCSNAHAKAIASVSAWQASQGVESSGTSRQYEGSEGT